MITVIISISLPCRLNPAAQFLWIHPAGPEPSPELQSHAASLGPAHGPGSILNASHHAQQLTEHPSGTNAVQFRERHADQPTEYNADKHTNGSAVQFTGHHRNKPANSNADQSTDTDTKQLTEYIAVINICIIQHG